MNKILVLGANSSVAKDLIKYLSNNNELYLIYRNVTKKKINKKFQNIKQFKLNEINKINKNKFDLIINCIAIHEFSKEKKLIDYVKSNIVIFLDFLNSGIKSKQILNLSTISKFDLSKKAKITEKNQLSNNSLLAITKATLDKLLKFQSIPNINLLLPGIVTRDKKVDRPFLKKIINDIKNKKKIEIFNLHKPFNSFIDTLELFNFINYILISKKVYNFDEYILCPSGKTTLFNLIKYYENIYNKQIKVIDLGENHNHYLLSNSKLKRKFEFYPSNVKDILKRLV